MKKHGDIRQGVIIENFLDITLSMVNICTRGHRLFLEQQKQYRRESELYKDELNYETKKQVLWLQTRSKMVTKGFIYDIYIALKVFILL